MKYLSILDMVSVMRQLQNVVRHVVVGKEDVVFTTAIDLELEKTLVTLAVKSVKVDADTALLYWKNHSYQITLEMLVSNETGNEFDKMVENVCIILNIAAESKLTKV